MNKTRRNELQKQVNALEELKSQLEDIKSEIENIHDDEEHMEERARWISCLDPDLRPCTFRLRRQRKYRPAMTRSLKD